MCMYICMFACKYGRQAVVIWPDGYPFKDIQQYRLKYIVSGAVTSVLTLTAGIKMTQVGQHTHVHTACGDAGDSMVS